MSDVERREPDVHFHARSSGGARWLLGIVWLSTGCALFGSEDAPPRWLTLSAERWYTCGVEATSRAVYCWGGTSGGLRGDVIVPHPDSLRPDSPIPLPMPPDGLLFRDVSVAENLICGLTQNDDAYCAGNNSRGEVGDGSTVMKRGFAKVAGGRRWRKLAAGGQHACGISRDATAYCWGSQAGGKLGDGVACIGCSVPVPVEVLGGHIFVTIRAGGGSTCGLTAEGKAWCWGSNDQGLLGEGNPPWRGFRAVPVPVAGEHTFMDLALGGYHACGLTLSGKAFCWGSNAQGQLGDGTFSSSGVPVEVSGARQWTRILPGRLHTCGVSPEDVLYCWGRNEHGQYGNGTTTESAVPLRVGPTPRFMRAIAGGDHMCSLDILGRAECWGRGDYGQLGNGRLGDRLRPDAVARWR